MLILARIQGITREAAGWPETMATATMAVAGARLDAGAGLQLDSKRTESTSRSYGALGARPGARTRRWPSVMTTATNAAAASFGRGGQGARGGIRRRGERGREQELTGRRRSRSVGSGTSLTARIDDEELGCPRLKTRLVRPLQGCRRCVAQRRGRGRHGGASGRVGEARGRRWPRWWRSAATGSLGWLRRERWGGEGGTRGGEMQGVSWRSWRPPAAAAASRRWPRACWRAEATRPCLLA